MTKWLKVPDEDGFDDEDLDDYEFYFNDMDDIDIGNFIRFSSADIDKLQQEISDSTSKGPPINENEEQKSNLKEISNQIPQQRIVQSPLETKSDRPLRINLELKFKIGLTSSEKEFREDFYSIFLNNVKGKRILPKEKVVMIHNLICKQAGVRKMRRDEYRIINNYFKNFARYKDQIIKCIIQNKEELSNMIDLPTIIEKANSNIEARKQRNKK